MFNRLLHLHGIQYRANGQWVLYSEHHGKGYTSSLTFRLQRSDGSEVEKLHTALECYLEWRIRLEHEMTKAEKNERGRTV